MYWKHSYIQVFLTSEHLSSLSTSTHPTLQKAECSFWNVCLSVILSPSPLSSLAYLQLRSTVWVSWFLTPIGNSLVPQGRKY